MYYYGAFTKIPANVISSIFALFLEVVGLADLNQFVFRPISFDISKLTDQNI
jgi:hypothetical protein